MIFVPSVVAASSRSGAKLDCNACPDGWALKSPGICQVTPAYKGPCGPFWDVSGYNQQSRDDFELLCYTKWQCHPHEELPKDIRGVDLKRVDVPKPTSAIDGVDLHNVNMPTKSPTDGVDLQHVNIPTKSPLNGVDLQHVDLPTKSPVNGVDLHHVNIPTKSPLNGVDLQSVTLPTKSPLNGVDLTHVDLRKHQKKSSSDDEDEEEHISHHEHKRRRRRHRRRHHRRHGHGSGEDDENENGNGGRRKGGAAAGSEGEFDEFGNRVGKQGRHGAAGNLPAPVLEPYTFLPPMDPVATASAAPSPFKPLQPVCFKD